MTDSVNRILSALSAVRVPAAPGEYDLHPESGLDKDGAFVGLKGENIRL